MSEQEQHDLWMQALNGFFITTKGIQPPPDPPDPKKFAITKDYWKTFLSVLSQLRND